MPDITQSKKRAIDRMQVRIEHLDTLLGLAGEVIITSASIHELQRALNDTFTRGGQISKVHMDTIQASDEAARRISQDLHELVMAIRLVEIGETLRLFRRPVRDLSRNLGREVDFVMEGDEVMIDKALAERLVDPLLHILRNAVDHGVESPVERSRLGKPTCATITLKAIDQENSTIITIQDDGRGVDAEAVYEKAAVMGLWSGDERPPLLKLLCAPGFSTSTEVTNTSGRGVGLDLVANVIDEFGGEVSLESTIGKGTLFKLVIPKLRAVNIVDALTVRAGDRLFAFSIDQIVSSVGISRSDVRTAMGGDQFIEYLEQVIVLRDLQELLDDKSLDIAGDLLPVVIVEGKAGRLALIVSEFLGPQKLVNVPLDTSAFDVRGVSGTSIFSGGRIGLTLDIDELVLLSLGEDVYQAPAHDAFALEQGAVENQTNQTSNKAKQQAGADTTLLMKSEDMNELLEELRRGLAALQDTLLSLEQRPEESDLIHEAFRRLHAAKGNLTMLEAEAAAGLAHALETVLDYLRSERLEVTTERMDLLLDGVAALTAVVDAMPGASTAITPELLSKLGAQIELASAQREEQGRDNLIGRTFKLSPTVELQLVSALKRGEHTLETYLSFESGRQAEFLISYLILRRIGQFGTILGTIPSVDEIEKGQCGSALKVLWSTPHNEEEVESKFELMGAQFNLTEWNSVATSIFSYEKSSGM